MDNYFQDTTDVLVACGIDNNTEWKHENEMKWKHALGS